VVAALGDELARRGEVLRRLLAEARRLGGVGETWLRRAVVDEATERRERLEAREGEPSALERARARYRKDGAASAPARRSP
jgi:hypothetical protein